MEKTSPATREQFENDRVHPKYRGTVRDNSNDITESKSGNDGSVSSTQRDGFLHTNLVHDIRLKKAYEEAKKRSDILEGKVL